MSSSEYRDGFMDGWNAAQGGTRIEDVVIPGSKSRPSPRKRSRTSTARDGKLSRALKTVNGRARKKNGSFKKGWTQGRVMREAHKLVRKM